MDFIYSVTFEHALVEPSVKLNEIFSLHFKRRKTFDGGIKKYIQPLFTLGSVTAQGASGAEQTTETNISNRT